MAKPKILLTRIDNRLVHGQVVNQWNAMLGADVILVANDDIAGNRARQALMDMAVPEGVDARYLSLERAAEALTRDMSAERSVFVIVNSPADALLLAHAGAPIDAVNVGNMHMGEGRRQVASSVAIGDEDALAFRGLKGLGVELRIQRVPSAPVEDSAVLFG